jgi:hypothetical protein
MRSLLRRSRTRTAIGKRTSRRRDGEVHARRQHPKVPGKLLEVPARDGRVRCRQFQQLVSDPANQRHRGLAADHDRIYATFNLVAAGISYPVGSRSDRLGRRNLWPSPSLFCVLTYLGFGLTRNVMAVAACFVLYGLYRGIARSVGKALATDLVPLRLRASGLGWYSATTGLLGLVANIVAGQLWDHVSHTAVFFCSAALARLGIIALMGLIPGDTSRVQRRRLSVRPGS